jgi:hypothetical protein
MNSLDEAVNSLLNKKIVVLMRREYNTLPKRPKGINI